MKSAENSQKKAAGGRPWKPGESGNPKGKPKGVKHKTTQLAEQMIGDEAQQIIRRVIDGALAGDAVCIRLCMERLSAPIKERAVKASLPVMNDSSDTLKAMAALVQMVGNGDLTPGEGSALAGLVDGCRKAIETQDIEKRIAALEQSIEKDRI